MRGPRRDVTARELLVLAVASCLVSVVMSWPLVLHLGQDIPRDLGDPLAESWQLAWDGHALAHQPLHFFDSNQFWPFHDTLAFSDALVGYAPGGALRVRASRGGVSLRPRVPVRLRAGVLRRVPLGPGARAGARGRRGRGGGVRVRSVSARAGRSHAGDLERRHPARARPRGPRLPAEAAGVGGGGIVWPPPGSSRSASRSACRSRTCSPPAR